jgi:predicted transposase/invertase (TIGR01784 family)
MLERGTGARRTTLDPKLDIVFWMLFGAEQNRPLLLSLLNAVLRPAVAIASVEVLHAEPERMAPGDKNIALDLRVRLENGEQVDVEMQSRRHPALRERALYYWARLYAGQLLRGDFYTELRACVVVLITDFSELASRRFHSIFRVQERHHDEPLTDHLELHVLELPKLQAGTDGSDEPNLTAWATFLAATTDEELTALAMENPVLKQAKDALDRLSADPAARDRAEQREMALLTYEAGLAKVRREGREEGKAELLHHLLTIKFGALPGDVTARFANASSAELLRWSERVLTADTLAGVFETASE